MKSRKSNNKSVTDYYGKCGAQASCLESLLWRVRAFPSTIYQTKRLLDTKSEILNLKLKGKVLDAPCGNGYLLRYLPAGSIGIDINPRLVLWAKQFAPGRKVMIGDIQKIPYPNNTFSAVLAAEIFEHIPDPLPLISEMWRVLKKEGLVIVTVPTSNFLWKIRYLASSMYISEPQCVTFSEEKLLSLFSGYSYEVEKIKKIALGLNYILILKKIKN